MEKAGVLSITELHNCIHRMDDALANYRQVCKNYTPELMRDHGVPYLNHLEAQREVFRQELDRRDV